MTNRMKYETTVTITVTHPVHRYNDAKVVISKDVVAVTPPVITGDCSSERALALADSIRAAAQRGRQIHRRLFGRNP